VFEARPESATLCDVTSAGSTVVTCPYAVVVPYSTCDVDASFVVHVTTAERSVRLPAVTAEMLGAVVSSTIVSVAAADQLPTTSLNCT
jgi:hypothetical protein